MDTGLETVRIAVITEFLQILGQWIFRFHSNTGNIIQTEFARTK